MFLENSLRVLKLKQCDLNYVWLLLLCSALLPPTDISILRPDFLQTNISRNFGTYLTYQFQFQKSFGTNHTIQTQTFTWVALSRYNEKQKQDPNVYSYIRSTRLKLNVNHEPNLYSKSIPSISQARFDQEWLPEILMESLPLQFVKLQLNI